MGKGKYLVPQLEVSPHCKHTQTAHGANRLVSYQKCLDCNQEQKMPLTPVAELHKWNNTMVYMHEDFLKRMINKTIATKAKAKPSTSLGAMAKSSSARPTAAKSKAAPVKEEVKEEDEEQYVDAAVWIGDDVEMVMEELTYSAHTQTCDNCHQGSVTLFRCVGTDNLFWKCDHPDCMLNYAEINQNMIEEAKGVFLCPQCSGKELVPINVTDDPQETEMQCINFVCNQRMLMFELPLAVLEDGQIQHHGAAVLSGCWLKNMDETYFLDENFGKIINTLNVDVPNTYVATGCGDVVSGVSPVTTAPIISRRLVLTKFGAGPWNAVNVTNVPGETYYLGQHNYLVKYEFNSDFVSYMVNAEFENEVTLTRAQKNELSGSLDGLLGDLSVYWQLWEQHASEPDDIAEVFGSLDGSQADDVVELYSPPGVVAAAAARGLKADLSIDLVTGYDLNKPQVRRQIREELRQRRPKLLVTSPPCTKFSPLQNLRPYPGQLEEELDEAIQHMDFSMDLLEDQLERGDHGLHEHPDLATSWTLKKVRKYLQHDEVLLIKSHLCRFGLRINGRLSRKSTLFATTCDAIAVNLQKLCDCQEPHQQLMGGLSKYAQEYPPGLVDAIIKGLIQEWVDSQQAQPEHMLELGDLEQWIDGLRMQEQQQWREFHGSAVLVVVKPKNIPTTGPGHRTMRWTWVKNPIDNKWIQFEQARSGKPNKLEVQYTHMIVLYHHGEINMTFAETGPSITTAEKTMVLRAHVNLGHPRLKEFVRLLKAAGTRNDIIQYVLREFQCEGCLKEKRQPTRLPASTPRTYDFNIVIGIDLLFVYGATPKEEHPVLNVTCVGTLYSTFTMVHPTRKSSALVWAAFLQSWMRVFGSPSFVIMDQGLEFQGFFVEGLENLGIQPILIDRDAPYQNGVTERRGGLFKEVYYRTRELQQPSDVTEVQNMIHEVSWALQTMTNRSGYSPAQRVFGKQPTLAMELINDTGEYEFSQTADVAWKRSEEITLAARKALVELDGKERLDRALRARPRRARENHVFTEGDPVYVWRQGKRAAQAKVGPCFVVLQKGDTVWVTRRGELWKCNRAQVFHMGNLEKQGLEAIPADLLRAKEKLRFHPEKLGYVDVEREGPPRLDQQPEQPLPVQELGPRSEPPAQVQRRAPPTPRVPPEGLRALNPQTPTAAATPGIMRAMPRTPALNIAQSIPVPETPPLSDRSPTPEPESPLADPIDMQQQQQQADEVQQISPTTPAEDEATQQARDRSRSPTGKQAAAAQHNSRWLTQMSCGRQHWRTRGQEPRWPDLKLPLHRPQDLRWNLGVA